MEGRMKSGFWKRPNERTMANRTHNKTYDVLAVSSTVHKANADYLAGILRYASGRQDWRLHQAATVLEFQLQHPSFQ